MCTESYQLPVSTADLAVTLSRILNQPARGARATALGASSRETPWRVDLESDAGERRLLVRFGESCSANEVHALQAMKDHPLPTPEVLHWDPDGEALGMPLFVSTFIDGEPLLVGMKAGEAWADQLYIDTVSAVNAIREEDLPPGATDRMEGNESALEVLDDAYERFPERDHLAEEAYARLKETAPTPHSDCFTNGDLWPENLLVRDRKLAGIIDWQHAGFTDPVFEFLLPFFLVPGLRGRGIEEAFCRRLGLDPGILHWYHGLEFFDSLAWVLKLGEPYEIHTAESLTKDLKHWLAA